MEEDRQEMRNLVEDILKAVGGAENVSWAMNCMTRLRIRVKDGKKIQEETLTGLRGVLGLVHDRERDLEVVVGPGRSGICGRICKELGLPQKEQDREGETRVLQENWREKRAALLARQGRGPVRALLKTFGDIFVPLLPGIIAAGLCAGLLRFLKEVFPLWEELPFLLVAGTLLELLSDSLFLFLTAWCGYRAAECFGATPILGGMLGMVTCLEEMNALSQALGLYNEASPSSSLLRSGRGGVLGVVLGVYVMGRVEKWVRSHMPRSLDMVLSPPLTLFFCLIPHVLLIMPLTGLFSSWLCSLLLAVSLSPHLWVRLLCGYTSAALFLPLVAMGMHHGLVAVYAAELEEVGYITLYPALCMAGAGQVGAALALLRKAKGLSKDALAGRITGALPAGLLGVGEPLIYGVTLPMGKPFLTAGLGAGFGGALVMALQVGSTSWGTSGVLGVFVMTSGPSGALLGAIGYLGGLFVSILAAFCLTTLLVSQEEVRRA